MLQMPEGNRIGTHDCDVSASVGPIGSLGKETGTQLSWSERI
jgi:hypothetical protein